MQNIKKYFHELDDLFADDARFIAGAVIIGAAAIVLMTWMAVQ